MKEIYTSVNREQAGTALAHFEQKWGFKYRHAVQSWYRNWDEQTAFFDFSVEVRKVIYTNDPEDGLAGAAMLWTVMDSTSKPLQPASGRYIRSFSSSSSSSCSSDEEDDTLYEVEKLIPDKLTERMNDENYAYTTRLCPIYLCLIISTQSAQKSTAIYSTNSIFDKVHREFLRCVHP